MRSGTWYQQLQERTDTRSASHKEEGDFLGWPAPTGPSGGESAPTSVRHCENSECWRQREDL